GEAALQSQSSAPDPARTASNVRVFSRPGTGLIYCAESISLCTARLSDAPVSDLPVMTTKTATGSLPPRDCLLRVPPAAAAAVAAESPSSPPPPHPPQQSLYRLLILPPEIVPDIEHALAAAATGLSPGEVGSRQPQPGGFDTLDAMDLDASDETAHKSVSAPPWLHLRGGLDDHVVLCTPTATYKVRELQTSNTLLLARQTPSSTTSAAAAAADECELAEIAHAYVELARVRPRLSHLAAAAAPLAAAEATAVFRAAAAAAPSAEGVPGGTARSVAEEEEAGFRGLLDSVQASEAEVRAGLVGIGAFWFN
ncbi:hypothetical protein HK405_014696, partial [Cladochytrium tenue]